MARIDPGNFRGLPSVTPMGTLKASVAMRRETVIWRLGAGFLVLLFAAGRSASHAARREA